MVSFSSIMLVRFVISSLCLVICCWFILVGCGRLVRVLCSLLISHTRPASRSPSNPAAADAGRPSLRTQRMQGGRRAALPAEPSAVLPPLSTYTAKPYASWPGWCVNYGQNVRYSISSIILFSY